MQCFNILYRIPYHLSSYEEIQYLIGDYMKNILNVGSGDTRYKSFKNFGFNLDIEYYPNIDTVASTQHLPFPDNSFHTVFSSHVLEHCFNPFQALKEMKRVSYYQVILIVPYINDKLDGKHIYSWTYESFSNLLSKVFEHYYVHGSFTRYRRHIIAYGKFRLLKVMFYKAILHYLRIPNEHIAICKVIE